MLDGNHEKYDIEVELTLFTPEEGGRKIGIPTNTYGPHIYLNEYEIHARFILQDREMLNPGETARAFVTFLFPALIKELHSDQPFLLHEGYHPIGRGRILLLLNFEKHVEQAKQKEKERNAMLSDPNRIQTSFCRQRDRNHPKKKQNKYK